VCGFTGLKGLFQYLVCTWFYCFKGTVSIFDVWLHEFKGTVSIFGLWFYKFKGTVSIFGVYVA